MARYRSKPVIVEAVKISRTITIETTEGSLKGYPGDYLITDANGDQYPCQAVKFESTYERIRDGVDVKSLFLRSLRKFKRKSKELFQTKS
ncbi:hypothetical protein [Halalkalibacter akibai]|uniref:Uncharacterized protein n=1 Tax=Halalkalibacter akibai (strain ATCC 43226 / DSM 21942 / CIP 109018 / JCM 9157 / 1139) TaxID=1236973 RepID=W4QYL1_HALA3|nr:hypothetical protein [Halalkalibacter akibai]GAE37235.1 hypothetical protein JCM9157_4503 [Halalkalibacter akibai JCM 9157]